MRITVSSPLSYLQSVAANIIIIIIMIIIISRVITGCLLTRLEIT